MSSFNLALPEDIPAIMAIERTPGYADLVGRWSAEDHAAQLAAIPGTRYLVARRDGRLDGFVILQGLDDANRCTTLRRIAVAEPGRGAGAAILDQTLEHVFRATPTHRLQLYVYEDNLRARRAYEKAGFREDGLVRDMRRMPDGRFRSMYLMSVLRPEWSERQPNRSSR